MNRALRLAVCAALAVAANRGLAGVEVPFTDGDMNVPGGTIQAAEYESVEAVDVGGGSGEPAHEPGERELRPKDESAPRILSEAELFTDQG